MSGALDLRISWPCPAAFAGAYRPVGPGRYTSESLPAHAIPAGVRAGTIVRVHLEFQGSRTSFRHRARVLQILGGERMILEFLHEESDIRDLILAFVAGEPLPYLTRRGTRSAVWVPARVSVGDEWRGAVLEDLSEVGAFVLLEAPPSRGTDLLLNVPTLGDGLGTIAARVVHRRIAGPAPGCGIEFLLGDAAAERRVARLVQAFVKATGRPSDAGKPR